MTKNKKDTIKKEEEQVVTDILESFFKDEEGTAKCKKVYMNSDKIVREEIVND